MPNSRLHLPSVARTTVLALCAALAGLVSAQQPASTPIVLHAARLLHVDTGAIDQPGEILVEGDRIRAVGTSVDHPRGAKIIDLGDTTLLPGLIDAHVHLFLHPGAEDLQTVEESVPWRTILAEQAAKADLLAGFTAERDMGTEGAGSADTAIRDAINQGLIPGPRMRISGNAIDIMGGPDRMIDGTLHTPYQYTAAQLTAAVEEARRLGGFVGVHAMGEPGTLYAAEAGVSSIDHATQLSAQTMRLMIEKQIPAVPTFTIFEYFAQHADSPARAAREQALLDYKIAEFKKQVAAGIPFAVGSDVGPFPHGTQARELELMVRYGMKPLAVLQADMIEGAKVLHWQNEIGQLKPNFFADIIAVPGNPLDDITAVEHVSFVMKSGAIVRQ
jgi:imidazolonepropionase-like amidohydrolase